MDESTNGMERRQFLAAGGIGAALAMGMAGRATAEGTAPTAAETANEKVVNDFCAAWDTLDLDVLTGFFDENITFRMIESMPRVEGKADWIAAAKGFLAPAKSAHFEVVRSQAMGNIVVNERIDHFDMGEVKNAFHVIGVFFVRNGKIIEWQDYTMPKA